MNDVGVPLFWEVLEGGCQARFGDPAPPVPPEPEPQPQPPPQPNPPPQPPPPPVPQAAEVVLRSAP